MKQIDHNDPRYRQRPVDGRCPICGNPVEPGGLVSQEPGAGAMWQSHRCTSRECIYEWLECVHVPDYGRRPRTAFETVCLEYGPDGWIYGG